MDEVGRDFAAGSIFVPEMMVSALVMQMGLGTIKPHLAGGEMKALGTVLIGAVKADMHDIGKNIVAMMMAANGFKVIDLGVNVPVNQKFTAGIGADAYAADAGEAVELAKQLAEV